MKIAIVTDAIFPFTLGALDYLESTGSNYGIYQVASSDTVIIDSSS